MRFTEDGYTLLEMLIGITLIGMLMAALAVGMHVGGKAWQQGEARLRQVHRVEERDELMSAQISSLVPHHVVSQDPELPGDFVTLEGTPFCLRFLSTFGSHFRNNSGLLFVEYALVRPASGELLLALRETPMRNERGLIPELIEGITHDPDTGKTILNYRPFSLRDSDLRLMTGLEWARFDYLDPEASKQGPAWVSTWEPKAGLPFPVAIRFAWQESGRQYRRVFPVRANTLPKPEGPA